MRFKKIYNLLRDPNLLHKKVIRRLRSKLHYLIVKIETKYDIFPYDNYDDQIQNEFAHLVTRPGNEEILKRLKSDKTVVENNGLHNILNHRFKILSDRLFETNHPEPKNRVAIADMSHELPGELVSRYQPIDWHKDFKSGYRWSDTRLYLDIPLTPIAGVDIKVPRELSRFQHIGDMLCSDSQQAANEFCLQVIDWISANPLRKGVNWACTMDVAIRAVNWIWGITFFQKEMSSYPEVNKIIAKSLIDHGNHIYDNLEYYEECTGNHYLSNIVGLVYIACCVPSYKESDEWLLFGVQELIAEMERQVYSDGYAHEASTHYHRLVTELFLSASILVEKIPIERRRKLDAVEIKSSRKKKQLSRNYNIDRNLEEAEFILPIDFYKRLRLMVEFTAKITKPNGLVPQIGDNDSARLHKLLPSNKAPITDHSHIIALGGKLFDDALLTCKGAKGRIEADLLLDDLLKIPSNLKYTQAKNTLFRDAGIAVVSNKNAWLCVTCGTNGQNMRGGHGHNDKNSFELNIGGRDFIVDGGCPFYTSDPEKRNKYRSAFAHSTLVIRNKEQDKYDEGIDGLFILKQTCDPILKLNCAGVIEGSHIGYRDKHVRSFKLSTNKLQIYDNCAAKEKKYLLFNVDPKVEVEIIYKKEYDIKVILHHDDGGEVFVTISGAGSPKILNGYFSKGFGIPIENKMLKVLMSTNSAKTTFTW